MRKMVVLLVVIIVVGSLPQEIMAQTDQQTQDPGQITGVVITSSGRNVANQTIQVRSMENGKVVTSSTISPTGSFAFANLSPGSYRVEMIDELGLIIGTSHTVLVTSGNAVETSVIQVVNRQAPISPRRTRETSIRDVILTILTAAGGVALIWRSGRPER